MGFQDGQRQQDDGNLILEDGVTVKSLILLQGSDINWATYWDGNGRG